MANDITLVKPSFLFIDPLTFFWSPWPSQTSVSPWPFILCWSSPGVDVIKTVLL